MSKYQSAVHPIRVQSRFGGYWHGASANDIKQFFGLRYEQKWPAEGMSERVVQGFTLYVNPMGKIIGRTRWGSPIREGMHSRLMAVCDICGRHVSYGRLHQHRGYTHGLYEQLEQ